MHTVYNIDILFVILNKICAAFLIAVAYRVCMSNGTWAQRANYDQCINVSKFIL